MTGRYALDLNEYNVEQFNEFVTEEQYKILIELIGTELYNTYSNDNGLEAWTNLLNGVQNYTDFYGYKRNWNGLEYLLKPFIFYKYIDLNEFQQSITGTVIAENENSRKATEYERKKITYRVWNEFVKHWYECYNFLYTNEATYTDFDLWFKEKKCKYFINKGSIS